MSSTGSMSCSSLAMSSRSDLFSSICCAKPVLLSRIILHRRAAPSSPQLLEDAGWMGSAISLLQSSGHMMFVMNSKFIMSRMPGWF